MPISNRIATKKKRPSLNNKARRPLAQISLCNRIAIIHFDVRQLEQRQKNQPPDIRSIAYLMEKDSRQLKSRQPRTARFATALFAMWDQVVNNNTNKLAAIKDKLISTHNLDIPPAQNPKTFPVVWNLPQTWRLIRLILTLDQALTVLNHARSQTLISSNEKKTLRGKLVRPVRHTFIEIAATSREFRKQIQTN